MSVEQAASGPARLQVRRGSGDVLIAGRLGDGLVVTAIDAELGCGGVLRCSDAHSSVDVEAARSDPGRFVDTGVTTLLRLLVLHGARPARLRMQAVVAVRGQLRQALLAALDVALARAGLSPAEVDVDGSPTRTVTLDLGAGATSTWDSGSRQVVGAEA